MASGPLPSAFPPPSRHHCRRLLVARAGDAPLAAAVPGRSPLLGPLPSPRASPASPAGPPRRCGRKHRLVEEPEGCPARKAAALAVARAPSVSWMSPSGPVDAPCEDMEQAGPEQQGEAARQKLQEIEDRLTEEEEEEEEEEAAEGSEPRLPTLVLSQALQRGLKQDYGGLLNKKIIESMSRPSMELVLWKPLPSFLPENHRSNCIRSYKPLVAERGLGKVAALEAAFQSQTEELPDQAQPTEMPLAHYGVVGPSGAAEEEMEL